MTDHDAIAARVRQDRKAGTPGPWVHDDQLPLWINMHDDNGAVWNVATAHVCCGHPVDGSAANARRIAALPDLEAAYLDLYDEVQRLRAFMRMIVDDRDRTFVLLAERAEEAEAERERLRAALTIYAQSGNWRLGGCCDLNSPNFTGVAIARQALKGDTK